MSKTQQIQRLKQISIAGWLESLNILPASQSRNELYYNSPFRTENTPSFTVNIVKNVWFDHGDAGECKGGDILDLAQQVLQADWNTAVAILEQVAVNPHVTVDQFTASATIKPTLKKNTLQVTRIEELEKPVLLSYLRSRNINLDMLLSSARTKLYLKQVYYLVDGRDKEYYALGWANNAGGYELRAKNFQSFVGEKKTYTYLKGTVPGIAIFESFMDYFSALTHFKRNNLGYDIMILNSTRMMKQSLEVVATQPHLHFFLDNDRAGLAAVAFYKKHCKDTPFTDHSHLYAEYKDFNDALTGTPPKQYLPASRDTVSKISTKSKWWLWVVFNSIDEITGKNKQRTFYAYNNEREGYELLLYLRAFKLEEQNVKLTRLCERTTGRGFKIIEEAWH